MELNLLIAEDEEERGCIWRSRAHRAGDQRADKRPNVATSVETHPLPPYPLIKDFQTSTEDTASRRETVDLYVAKGAYADTT